MYGTTQSSTPEVELDITWDPDPSRFQRLADLLFASTMVIAGSTAFTLRVSP